MQKIKKSHRYFETQGADEKVLIVARRHWTVYTSALSIAFVIYVLEVIVFLSIEHIGFFEKNQWAKAVSVVLFSVFLLFATLFIFINWLVNYLNVQIVTDSHIVDIDQSGLFSRKISELSLDEIQDISATKKGVIQSSLDYGDICIQTAGEKPNFNFEKVPEPHELARKIMEIKDQHVRSEHHRMEQGMGQAGVSDTFSQEGSIITPPQENNISPSYNPEVQHEDNVQMPISEPDHLNPISESFYQEPKNTEEVTTENPTHENENFYDSQHQENEETNF